MYKKRHIPKKITDKWTDRERLSVILVMSRWLENTGEEHALKHEVTVSSHILQDLGVRMRLLAMSSAEELEQERHEILNGNAAKYI